MTTSKTMFIVAGFLIAAAIALPARAGDGGNHHKEYCGGGNWDLVKTHDARCEYEAKKVDKNGNHDDYVCEKYKYGVIKYRDNDKY